MFLPSVIFSTGLFKNKSVPFQISQFSKYISKSRAKHLPLNTKFAGKGYKKGYGARRQGRNTSKGTFVTILSRRTELVVPDLTNFKVHLYLLSLGTDLLFFLAQGVHC
jgi:hypothetical protein